ncbi:hypothetical protein OAN61_00510 [bacterium]|nr:hypothetical protein [bacterium]
MLENLYAVHRFVNHKLKKTTMDDPWKLTNVLDSEVEFTDLARTLCLLRQSVRHRIMLAK